MADCDPSSGDNTIANVWSVLGECGVCGKQLPSDVGHLLLPCCHSSCADCIEDNRNQLTDFNHTNNEKPKFLCKLCSQEYSPEECIDNSFQTIYRLRNSNECKDNVAICQSCSDNNPGVIQCKDCDWICESCHTLHNTIKVFKDHELDQSSKRTVNTVDKTKSICSAHNEEITVYCKTCRGAYCARCILRDHNLHIYEDSKDSTQMNQFIGHLKTKVAQIKEKRNYCENTLEKFESIETNIGNQKDVCIDKIKSIIQRLHSAVDDMGKQLLDNVDNQCNEKVKEFGQKKGVLRRMNGSFLFIEQFINTIIDLNEPMSLLKAQDLLNNQLQKLLNKPCSHPDFIKSFTIEVKQKINDLDINRMIDVVLKMYFKVVSSDDKPEVATSNNNINTSNAITSSTHTNANVSSGLDDDIQEILELPNSRPRSTGQTNQALIVTNIGNNAQTSALHGTGYAVAYNQQNQNLVSLLQNNVQPRQPRKQSIHNRQPQPLQPQSHSIASNHLQNINTLTNSIAHNTVLTANTAQAVYGNPGVYRGPVPVSAQSCQMTARPNQPPNYMSIVTMANPPNVSVPMAGQTYSANNQPIQPSGQYSSNIRTYTGNIPVRIINDPNAITRHLLLQPNQHQGRTTTIYPNQQSYQNANPQQMGNQLIYPNITQQQLAHQSQHQPQTHIIHKAAQPSVQPQLQSVAQTQPNNKGKAQSAIALNEQQRQESHRRMQLQKQLDIMKIMQNLQSTSPIPNTPMTRNVSQIIESTSQNQTNQSTPQYANPVNTSRAATTPTTATPHSTSYDNNNPYPELHIPDDWSVMSGHTIAPPARPTVAAGSTSSPQPITTQSAVTSTGGMAPARTPSTDSGIQTPPTSLSMPTAAQIVPNNQEISTKTRRVSEEMILPNSPSGPFSVDSLLSPNDFTLDDGIPDIDNNNDNNNNNNTVMAADTVSASVPTPAVQTPTAVSRAAAPVAVIAPQKSEVGSSGSPNDMITDDDSDIEFVDEDAFCVVCDREYGEFIICGRCSRSFHKECHVPEIKIMPESMFLCTFCKDIPQTQNAGRARGSGFSERQQRIGEKVVIALVCHQLSQPFKHLSEERPNYSLLAVKKKLENKVYETEEDFIEDIKRLIAKHKERPNISVEDMNNYNTFERFFKRQIQKFMPDFTYTFTTNNNANNTDANDNNNNDGNNKRNKTSCVI